MLLLVTCAVVIAAGSAYLASLVCRRARSHGRYPGWHLAILTAVCVGALTVLSVYQGDLFRPAKWDSGKAPLLALVSMCFGLSSIIAFFPALYVVAYHR